MFVRRLATAGDYNEKAHSNILMQYFPSNLSCGFDLRYTDLLCGFYE